MNKNLKNTIIHKFPIISILILILIYIYLNFPNNINSILQPQQKGGVPLFELPPYTPMLYKYRFGFVVLPILLILLIIYYIYYINQVVKKYTVWDLGLDFFSNFQKQYNDIVKLNGDPEDYKQLNNPNNTKDQKAYYNILAITADPLGGLYTKAQYFCNAARPCNCCLDNNYTKYFFNCADASKCTDSKYVKMCKNPTGFSTPSKNSTPS